MTCESDVWLDPMLLKTCSLGRSPSCVGIDLWAIHAAPRTNLMILAGSLNNEGECLNWRRLDKKRKLRDDLGGTTGDVSAPSCHRGLGRRGAIT